MSVEQTFGAMSGEAEQVGLLEELAESLAADLAREDLAGRTITLKYKTVAFTTRTRAHSLPRPVSGADALLATAKTLLEAARQESKGRLELRLLGLRVSGWGRAEGGLAGFLEGSGVECPVCGQGLPPSEEAGSRHVEDCLSQRTIREMLGENPPRKRPASPIKRPPKAAKGTKAITQFFAPQT